MTVTVLLFMTSFKVENQGGAYHIASVFHEEAKSFLRIFTEFPLGSHWIDRVHVHPWRRAPTFTELIPSPSEQTGVLLVGLYGGGAIIVSQCQLHFHLNKLVNKKKQFQM